MRGSAYTENGAVRVTGAVRGTLEPCLDPRSSPEHDVDAGEHEAGWCRERQPRALGEQASNLIRSSATIGETLAKRAGAGPVDQPVDGEAHELAAEVEEEDLDEEAHGVSSGRGAGMLRVGTSARGPMRAPSGPNARIEGSSSWAGATKSPWRRGQAPDRRHAHGGQPRRARRPGERQGARPRSAALTPLVVAGPANPLGTGPQIGLG